jgi:hypothetical protein
MNSLMIICEFAMNGTKKMMMIFIKKSYLIKHGVALRKGD